MRANIKNKQQLQVENISFTVKFAPSYYFQYITVV